MSSTNFGLGISSYGKAFSLIFNKGLWGFFAAPFILNLAIFFGGSELIDIVTEYIQTEVMNMTSLEGAEFWGSNILKGALTGLIWLLFKITFFFLFAYVGGYMVLIILSPVLAFLSEKSEKILTGNDYPFDINQLMRDVVRGVLIALRNMGIEIALMILVFVLGLIPVLGWIVNIVGIVFLFLVSSYFYGFSYMDYNNERRRLSIKDSVKIIRKYKWAAIANGAVFSAFLFIPLCGFVLASFFSIVSVVAATITMQEIYKKEKDNFNFYYPVKKDNA